MAPPPDHSPAAEKPVSGPPTKRAGDGAGPDASNLGGALPSVDSTGVDDMVQEIRDGLAQISARELELRRREQHVDLQYREMQQVAEKAAADGVRETSRHHAQLSAELTAREEVLATREGRLREAAQELRARRLEVEQRRRDVALQTEKARQLIERLRVRRRRHHKALRDRIAVIRHQEQELKRRIQLAHQDVTQRRDVLGQRQTDLRSRATRLDQAESELRARRDDMERRLEEGEALAGDVERQQEELNEQWRRLEQERRQIERENEQVQADRNVLLEKQGQFEQRWRDTKEQRHQLARQLEDVAARRRILEQDQTGFRERGERLEHREQQFREKWEALRAEKERLQGLEAELAERQADTELAAQEAEDLRAEARRQQEESLALREQAEARDAETRQTSLAIEVERERLEGETAALEWASKQLDGLRAEREQAVKQARTMLADRARRVREAERSLVAAPRLWWLRSTGLAVLVAIAAGVVWLMAVPQSHRATAELHITSASPSIAEVTTEHRRRLLDPHLFDDAQGGSGLAADWRDACRGGRVRLEASDSEPVLWLSVTMRDRAQAERLLRDACDAYAQRVNAQPVEPVLAPRYDRLATREKQLDADVEQWRQKRIADEAALVEIPGFEQQQKAIVEADRLQTELTQAVQAVDAARAELAVLVAADVPPGVVSPADIESTLGEDVVYQEDRREFRAAAEQYRRELVVAMVQSAEPVDRLQKALQRFSATLTEQQELDPPAEIRSVLELCAADIAGIEGKLAPYAKQWQEWLDNVQAMDISEDVVELVRRQNRIADAARQLADQATKLVEGVKERLENLSETGDGGTREVVVTAVLRADHSALQTAADDFVNASGQTSLVGNFELDTQDRKLRGLRMRLNHRRQTVQDRLQLEADHRVRETHAADTARARTEIRGIERRREELVADLMAAMKVVRDSDDAARRRGELEARLEQDEAQIRWLDERRGEISQELAEARRAGPEPDRVEIGEPIIAGVDQGRYRSVGLVAGAGFVGTWLVCALMLARNPWRRTEGDDLLELLAQEEGEQKPAE